MGSAKNYQLELEFLSNHLANEYGFVKLMHSIQQLCDDNIRCAENKHDYDKKEMWNVIYERIEEIMENYEEEEEIIEFYRWDEDE